jgi:hypothetical protein
MSQEIFHFAEGAIDVLHQIFLERADGFVPEIERHGIETQAVYIIGAGAHFRSNKNASGKLPS